MAGKGKERASEEHLIADDGTSDDAVAFRDQLLHKLRTGRIAKHRVTAWCPQTGLIAYPAPSASSQADALQQSSEPTASTSLLPLSSNTSPSICMTLPSLPSASHSPAEQVSFTLHLPEAPSAVLRSASSDTSNLQEYISHLSFSPDGNHLAVFTSFKRTTSPIGSSTGQAINTPSTPSIRFLLYQRGDEINTWLCTFDWDSKRAKSNLLAASKAGMKDISNVDLDSPGILDVKWLQQNSASTGNKHGRKRGIDALLDFSGTSTLVAVLESSEVLLIHLPYQAIQPQVFVTSLTSDSTTAQDLAGLGTSFSPVPTTNLVSEATNSNGILNCGVLDSLGMNLNSTIPVDPLQSALNTNGRTLGVGISLARLGVSAATTNTHKVETRIASVGPSSTREISNTLPAEGPPILVSELLIAYQETYQPKLLRRQPVSETVAGQDHSLQNDTTGMQLDNVTIDNNALMDQINQHINSNTQQIIDQGNNSTAGIPQNSVPNITQDFSLPDLQSYGQGTGFETGYGDINLSALDELFDSDFGGASGSGSGNNNVVSGSDNDGYNADSTLGGLSSTLNSINQDFASSFPSATEPNGTPSPTKKEVSSSSSSNNNNDNNVSNGTNKSDSPTKSMFEGTYGGSNNSLESRGNSPRKSLNLNGSEDDLSLPEYLDDVLDEGNRVKTLSRIQISQLRIEWTEYGVLNIGINPTTTINSQTAFLSEATQASPPSAITQLHFMSDFERKEAPTLLALSYPLAIEEDNTLSSNVQAYSISQEPFELSDAFSSLEGRKADPDMSFLGQTLEWVVKPVEIAPLQNVSQNGRAILDLWERGGRLEGISVDKEGEVWLSHLSSASKEGISGHKLPRHYPLSIVVSPSSNLALACAFNEYDESSMVGNPALFALLLGEKRTLPTIKDEIERDADVKASHSNMEILSSALIDGLVARRSVRDVFVSVDRLSSDDKTELLRQSWKTASGLLQGASVEQTRLLWPLLAIQRQLYSRPQAAIIDDIMQLSACLRILQDNKATFRNASQQSTSQMQVNETFDGDAIWPIIGHITWMFNLWDRTILNMTSGELDRDWSSASFLIMHPLPRMLQQRLVRLIARFANYMMNLREGTLLASGIEDSSAAVLDTELAKTVLGDIIVSQRQKTQEWNNMLQGLTNKLGSEWTEDISKGREALLTLQLPPQLERTAREMAFGMKQKLLPLLHQQQGDNAKTRQEKVKRKIDVVMSVPLKASTEAYRTCTLCSGKTQLHFESSRSEWGRSKRRSCICGGQWVAVA